MSHSLLTARQVAEQLGVSTETVLRWTRRGKLRAIQLPGGAIRIRDDELDAKLEEWATPAQGVRTTKTDAATTAPYRQVSTDANGGARGLPLLVRTTMPGSAPAPEDKEPRSA